MKCLTIMRKYAILNIHKILQSEQYIKSKDNVALTETFRYLELRSTCLKEGSRP